MVGPRCLPSLDFYVPEPAPFLLILNCLLVRFLIERPSRRIQNTAVSVEGNVEVAGNYNS